MKQQLHWLAMHGVVRALATWSARRGDPQARLIADPAVRSDPMPFYDELRGQGTLVRSRTGYIAVDHAVAQQVLSSEDFGVMSLGSTLPAPLRWLEQRTRTELLHPLRAPSLLAVEPPEHTRYRKTVSSVFTARAVGTLRDQVAQTADDLLDELTKSTGVVDVVAAYCAQLPVAMIGEILGVPDADRPKILEFGELAAPSLDLGLSWRQYQQAQKGVAGLTSWLAEHLRQLRQCPGQDLMSNLIAASDDGDPLEEAELQATAGLVLAAGFETTINLLGNGIRLLLNHPDQLAKLTANPSMWPNAVAEILRLESPVQLAARVARVDSDIAGIPVSRGQVVVISLAAANRDPAVFPDPHRFDVHRPNAGKHLAFSGGRHFCLGAALARAEGEIGLRQFFSRFPHAELASTGTRRSTRVLRGWAELPVALGSTTARVG